jgi:hypothetical protein
VAGEEHMDGVRALAYARIRKSDNDFRRIERQQLVVRATANKATSLGTILTNPIGIYRQFQDSIDTDIPSSQLPNLAELAGQIDLDTAPLVSLASATIDCAESCFGAAALLWDAVAVKDLQAQVFTDGRLQKEGAVVSVKNGTPTPDLAAGFATFLSKQGMPSSKIAVDELFDGNLADETAIYDLGGKDYTARKNSRRGRYGDRAVRIGAREYGRNRGAGLGRVRAGRGSGRCADRNSRRLVSRRPYQALVQLGD